MSRKKQTPVTMEMLEEQILPRIEEIFEEKIQKYRSEVVDFKVEVVGELKSQREEVSAVNIQYERTNKKINKIAKKLNIAL